MTRRIAPVLAVVAAFYAVMVPIRIHQHGVLSFVHIGDRFLASAHTSPAIDSVRKGQSEFGYDGQSYFFIAADPAHAKDYLRQGPGGDESARRYARILYPMAVRAVSLGRVGAIPYAMLVLNLLAVGAGTFAVGLWLRRRGRSPWFAAVYGLWPGMVFAVFRDLNEPLAFCLAALAVLVFDTRSTRRVWAACSLLALALLCRETVIVLPVAGALALWLRDRTLRRPALFVAAAIAPMIAWRIAVTAWLHATTFENAGGWRVLLPFYGMHAWWPWDAQHWVIALTCDVPLLLAAGGGIVLLQRRRAIPAATLLVLNAALFIVFIPRSIVIDFGAASRNVMPALLAALYCLPAWRSHRAVLGLAALLSPLWFIAVAEVAGVQWLKLITQ